MSATSEARVKDPLSAKKQAKGRSAMQEGSDLEHETMRTAQAAMPKLIRLAMWTSVSAIVASLTASLAVVMAMRSPVAAIGISPDGKMVPLVTIDKPYLPESNVLGFATDCIRMSLSHSWSDSVTSMANASKCYTDTGWKDFSVAIDPLIKEVREKRMNMLVAIRPAEVVATGKNSGGAVVWKISTVADLSLEGTSTKTSPRKYLVTVFVVRVPLEQGLNGIKVSSMTLAPYVEH